VRGRPEVRMQVGRGLAVLQDLNVEHAHHAGAQSESAEVDLVRACLDAHTGGRQRACHRAGRSYIDLEAEDLVVELIGQAVGVDEIRAGCGKQLRQCEMTVGAELRVIMDEDFEVAADDDHMELLGHLDLVAPDWLYLAGVGQPEIEPLLQGVAWQGGHLKMAFGLRLLSLQRKLSDDCLRLRSGDRSGGEKQREKQMGCFHRFSMKKCARMVLSVETMEHGDKHARNFAIRPIEDIYTCADPGSRWNILAS
jgi:hypothetical protein